MAVLVERDVWGNIRRSGIDTAQVCLNGHVTNEMAETSPELNKPFCGSCGKPTIKKCPKCNKPIHGFYHVPGVAILSFRQMKPAAHCYGCGTPYPWTQANLEALAGMLTLVGGLSDADRSSALALVPDLMADTPKTGLATLKWKPILAKASGEAGKFMRDVLVNIVSEVTAKAMDLK